MAGLVRRLARSPLGLWLWRRSRSGAARALADGAVALLTDAERAVLRRLPAHRRHDRAQARLVEAFEAETRRLARGRAGRGDR